MMPVHATSRGAKSQIKIKLKTKILGRKTSLKPKGGKKKHGLTRFAERKRSPGALRVTWNKVSENLDDDGGGGVEKLPAKTPWGGGDSRPSCKRRRVGQAQES